MQSLLRRSIVLAAVIGAASTATAQDLKLTMAEGRVTLIAHEVPLQRILAEWARVGDTRIVNGDKLFGPPVTLELVDVPEGRALDMVLRQAAGYMAAPRPAGQPGVSLYDRILILPTSRPPTVTASTAPQPFNRTVMPQPMPVPVDDQDEPVDQGPVPPPGMVPQGVPVPGPQPMPGPQPVPGPQQFPGAAVPQGQGQQQGPVLTAPRPGQLPAPQAQPPGINPYAPPGNRPRPGGGPGGQ